MLCFSDEEQNLNYIVRKIKRLVFKNPQKKINLIPCDYLLYMKLRAIFENDNVYVMDSWMENVHHNGFICTYGFAGLYW